MSKTEAKKITKKYAEKLKQEKFPFLAIYLFGSHAKGKANKWSDIDIAVISDKFKRNNDKNRWLLWNLTLDVDTRIEPHGFTKKDFSNEADPMAHEIKKTGIKIV